MAKTIVVTSGKGGVGKTTSTANIGVALALKGNRVIVIDADTGLRNLDVVMGLEDKVNYNLIDVARGNCRLRQAMIKDKKYMGLYLLPTAQAYDKSHLTANTMKKIVKALSSHFDYILIDCPAGIEQGFQTAVAPAEEAILVTTPEISAIRDADRIVNILSSQDAVKSIKLIVNRVRPELQRSGDMISTEDILDILNVKLLGIVPDEEDIVIASNRGEAVSYDLESRTGQAYRNIAQRLMGEDIPIMNLGGKQGFFHRFVRKKREYQ